MLSQIKKGKYAKAGVITNPRTRTVTKFIPIFFDIPSKDDGVQVNAIDQNTVDEDYFLDDYWDT